MNLLSINTNTNISESASYRQKVITPGRRRGSSRLLLQRNSPQLKKGGAFMITPQATKLTVDQNKQIELSKRLAQQKMGYWSRKEGNKLQLNLEADKQFRDGRHSQRVLTNMELATGVTNRRLAEEIKTGFPQSNKQHTVSPTRYNKEQPAVIKRRLS